MFEARVHANKGTVPIPRASFFLTISIAQMASSPRPVGFLLHDPLPLPTSSTLSFFSGSTRSTHLSVEFLPRSVDVLLGWFLMFSHEEAIGIP
jgi:hypothetical protein